jgi:hypothetical protein
MNNRIILQCLLVIAAALALWTFMVNSPQLLTLEKPKMPKLPNWIVDNPPDNNEALAPEKVEEVSPQSLDVQASPDNLNYAVLYTTKEVVITAGQKHQAFSTYPDGEKQVVFDLALMPSEHHRIMKKGTRLLVTGGHLGKNGLDNNGDKNKLPREKDALTLNAITEGGVPVVITITGFSLTLTDVSRFFIIKLPAPEIINY